MTIRIGETALATRRPRDLDKALLADAGCNAAEVARMLSGQPLAGTVARALLPFLPEEGRPAIADLASQIDAAGTGEVAAQVAALYAATGADDLDGLTIPRLREKALEEEVDLAGLKRLDDIAAAIRADRLAKADAAAQVAE
jgi:hypothetical protein